MKLLSNNAESTLASLASSIGRDPKSWEGWFCLNLLMPAHHAQHIGWINTIAQSYIKDSDGQVFCCRDGQIYIICNNVVRENLEQIAQLVSDLIVREHAPKTQAHTIFNLGKHGSRFADIFFERCKDLDFSDHTHSAVLEKDHEHALAGLANTIAAKHDGQPVKMPCVLLVEDDPITQFMVKKSIRDECTLITAPDAEKVFSLYALHQPDIVLLDINLPSLDGYDVLEWIMDNDPGACVIMFSGNHNMDNIVKSMNCGAKGFIGKPFAKDTIMHYIQNYTA